MSAQLWQNLPVMDLQAEFNALNDVALPLFSGNVLRAALGLAFKQTVCAVPKRTDCAGCVAENICGYSKIFLTNGNDTLSHYPYQPCFAWTDIETPCVIKSGGTFVINLRLLGKAAEFYPYFYFALDAVARNGLGLRNSAGDRGTSVLKRITKLCSNGEKELLFSDNMQDRLCQPKSEMLSEYVSVPSEFSGDVTIDIISPLRIKYNGSFSNSLDYHILLRAIMRRLTALELHSFGNQSSVDVSTIIGTAQNVTTTQSDLIWKDFSRHSFRQDTDMKLGGLMGTITFSEVPKSHLCLLKAAEFTSVGKGISFGFGRFYTEIK